MFCFDKDIIRKTTFYKKLEVLGTENIEQYKAYELDKRCAGELFKFIQFGEKEEDNRKKLATIFDKKLWFGCPWTMNDTTEFKMPSNTHFRSTSEGEMYKMHCSYIYEMYVLCSFSTYITENMWSEYANDGNGLCLVFDVTDYDWFFPVEYIKNKEKYSYVPAWRRMIKRYFNAEVGKLPNLSPISTAPFFIKDQINPDTGNDSSLEKEVRAIYCMYSEDEINQGILIPGYCQKNKICGTEVNWEAINLSLSKVILGHNLSDDLISKIKKNFKNKCTYSYAHIF